MWAAWPCLRITFTCASHLHLGEQLSFFLAKLFVREGALLVELGKARKAAHEEVVAAAVFHTALKRVPVVHHTPKESCTRVWFCA